MRLCVLGGCAAMARPLLTRLRDDADVTAVAIADRDAAKARELAAAHGAKFKAVACDAMDDAAVVDLLRKYDAALCYIGPFYVFESRLARCAIEARRPYVSIADDYDAYLNVIQLDEQARAADVKVLTGFGNSPGLTQLLARKGYNEVASPQRITVNWCAGSDEVVGASNLTHLFHIFNGSTLQWFNGRERRVNTGAGKKWVDFPPPIGRAAVYYTGHAESVSLPRNLPGLEEVTLHGGVKPNYIVTLLRIMRALGLMATHKRRTALANFFIRFEHWFSSPGLDQSVGRVEVHGRDGARRIYCYAGHIADITSMPAYLAVKWLLAGKFDSKPGGVYAAERLMDDPTDFLRELEALGIQISVI